LQLGEVERYAPQEPTPEDIDREVQGVRARFASPSEFDVALARSGLDLARLRERLRDDLRIHAYLDQRFSAKEERRQLVIDGWMVRLSRSASIISLYLVVGSTG